ncbi:hypothetical protein DERF_005110 [Dermatophagoides farinae]|nr:hypothetical protein DERF_005110 [Dermatophagoides farinae]
MIHFISSQSPNQQTQSLRPYYTTFTSHRLLVFGMGTKIVHSFFFCNIIEFTFIHPLLLLLLLSCDNNNIDLTRFLLLTLKDFFLLSSCQNFIRHKRNKTQQGQTINKHKLPWIPPPTINLFHEVLMISSFINLISQYSVFKFIFLHSIQKEKIRDEHFVMLDSDIRFFHCFQLSDRDHEFID